MTSTKRSRPGLPKPCLFEASNQGLHLDSTLSELSQYQFQVESYHLANEITRLFEQHPLVPGVVLLEQQQFLGMISRQRFLECLIRPQGLELFLTQPLSVLHSYTRINNLILPASTPIRMAAQVALRRLPEHQSEPIVVQIDSGSYTLLDIHELNVAYWQIRGIETQVRYERAQVQMIQTEKMASLGRLVDGVAHEILDPVSFIWGNLTHVSTYTEQIMGLLSAYEICFPTIPEALQDLQTDIELDYVRQDLPQTIASIKAGADRLKTLVTSLQNFCHIDDVYPKPADLHQSLDSILLLLKSRLTGDIEIVKNYGHLPPVACFNGQLNQVFMNILTNAIDALINQAIRQELAKEFGKTDSIDLHLPVKKPQITITTQVRSRQFAPTETDPSKIEAPRWVSIQIADNGPGLSHEQYQRIMDSFSVKKRAEKETSLSVSYQIITARHGGKLHLKSHPDVGTEFEILLPLA